MSFTAGYSAFNVADLLEDEQAKEAFAHFGLAIHVSNILEHAIVNALLIFEMLPTMTSYKNSDEWSGAIDEFFDNKFSLTFGNLLKQLLAKGKLSGDLVEMLESAKTVRDYLVHHFQRESSELFFSQSGRESIIQQCEHAVALFKQTDVELDLEMLPIRKAMGFDEDWFTTATEAAMREMVTTAERNDR